MPDALLDASYFCTLMVYTGDADGLEGPIQYDAAVGASVARSKMPDSEVPGHATVLVFADLNTGNNTCKAVPALWPLGRCCGA